MTSSKLERLVSLIFKANREFHERDAHGGGVDPFTYIRLEAMRFISTEGSPTMKEVAAHLKVTAPSATSLVSGLVTSGYVVRKESDKDRRVVRLAMTAKGRKALESGMSKVASHMKRQLSCLEPEDIDTLIGIFERLLGSLGNERSKDCD